VHLAVLDGTDIVYVAKICGHDRVPMPTRFGGRHPASSTALGKVMLAFSASPQRERVIQNGLRPTTSRTITEPAAFRAELTKIAAQGVAFDRHEARIGLVCVAVPIFGRTGKVVAAASISGPHDRLDVGRIAPALKDVGGAISRALQRVASVAV
jgi:DNA-binding IclR family transcriptional regulator